MVGGKSNQKTARTAARSIGFSLMSTLLRAMRKNCSRAARPDARLGVYAQRRQRSHLIAVLFGVVPGTHQHKEIRLALAIEQLIAPSSA